MRLSPALACLTIGALLAACATQLDESGEPLEAADPPGGSGGAASKGGSGAALGGSGVGGKGGSGGSSGSASGSGGKGGTASAGNGGTGEGGSPGSAGAGTGGSSGSSGSTGTSGSSGSSGSGGTDVGAGGAGSTSCDGLPVWTANTEPPNKPMLQGDELTYMNHKFAVEPAGAMINWWNDVCPPTGTRESWCETDAQRYVDLGACE